MGHGVSSFEAVVRMSVPFDAIISYFTAARRCRAQVVADVVIYADKRVERSCSIAS
jgi:hypothetical protein